MDPKSINNRGLAYCYTGYIYIEREGRWTSKSIKHRVLTFYYSAYIVG